ncbi:MAG TPA: hypothetical protein VJX92_12230 [Methylomirabilota bacterium]|nr:hypothetical protein [Methylomirabilota bacterium]
MRRVFPFASSGEGIVVIDRGEFDRDLGAAALGVEHLTPSHDLHLPGLRAETLHPDPGPDFQGDEVWSRRDEVCVIRWAGHRNMKTLHGSNPSLHPGSDASAVTAGRSPGPGGQDTLADRLHRMDPS